MSSELWYRQFWPWFLIALPASVVVASIYTVGLAFRSADTLIEDDYYKEGLAINQSIAREQMAIDMGLKGYIEIYQGADSITQLRVLLEGSGASALSLKLNHPFEMKLDQHLLLLPTEEPNLYQTSAPVPLQRWYLEFTTDTGVDSEQNWRIQLEHDFRDSNKVSFGQP